MEITEVARLVRAVGRADMDAVAETREKLLVLLAEDWVDDVGTTGLRASTLKQYMISLKMLGRAGVMTPAQATPIAVRAFMKSRLALGRSPETVNRNLAALTSLLGWLHAEGRVPLAQVLELRELYLERPFMPPPAFLSREAYPEVRAAARAIAPRQQFELLVAFGVEAGLRFHEAQQLHGEDLALEDSAPYVRVSLTHGRRNKTDRERTVPIRAAFAQELLAIGIANGPIFRARVRRCEQLRSPYLHRGTFRALRKKALEHGPWWNWNLLRHTFASWNAQAGRSLPELAAWLGCGEDVVKRYAALMPGGNWRIEEAFVGVPHFGPKTTAA
jgi:integrase